MVPNLLFLFATVAQPLYCTSHCGFFFSFHDAVNDIIIIIIYLNFFFY